MVLKRGMGAGYFVAVAFDDPQTKVEVLLRTKDDIPLENEHPFYPPKYVPGWDVDQRRALYAWAATRQGVYEFLIGLRRRERIRHEPVPGWP